MTPKITVFMAAYNAERYIKESIQSILDQTFNDFELLIVNDGSTDRTTDVISSFHDPRIRVLHNDTNRGLVYTRNVALKEARGEYIAILDSDDVAVTNRLELQYNYFKKHPDIVLCGGHGAVINAEGKSVDDNRLIVPCEQNIVKMTLLFLNTYVNSTVMYKTTVLRELNGYREYAPAEDYELFIRIAKKYPVSNINQTLVKYRDHQSNTSHLLSDTYKIKARQIKANQLYDLGISPTQHNVEIMFSLLIWDYSKFTFVDYLELFTSIKEANRKRQHYPIELFERLLFNRWFEIIYIKKAKMNALPLLFSKELFKMSLLTAKQFRKALKLSLKGIGRISK